MRGYEINVGVDGGSLVALRIPMRGYETVTDKHKIA